MPKEEERDGVGRSESRLMILGCRERYTILELQKLSPLSLQPRY